MSLVDEINNQTPATEPDVTDEPITEVVDKSGEDVDNPEAESDTVEEPGEKLEGEGTDKQEGDDDAPVLEGEFYDALRAAYPDDDLTTPEAFQEKAVEHISELEKYRTENRQANKILNELFTANPDVFAFTKDLVNGMPMVVALAKNFDLTKIEVDPKDENHEAWAKAKAEREAAQSEQEKRVKEYEDNQKASIAVLNSFAEKAKIPETKATEFFGKIDQLLSQVATGNITENFLNIMFKGLEYDMAVQTAADEGRKSGRNEKIVATKENKPKGDAIPHIASSGSMPEKPRQPMDWASEVILSKT